ncbi:hypothetical protein [Staphylococcus xylosus]|uniref:hypothetical protein n=1 Tax=Staphylococcus xylosus TaxID=1288 RepID=UPI0004129562|nr:hypothetical protein [Staphylococcus xylosus]
MIINKKKYEKLNNDLVDVKVKAFNDVKKALDGENKVMRLCLQIKEQRDQYKSERDTLIDDIAVLKANISRLERENRDLKHENKALRLQSNTYFDEWQSVKKQYSTLTNHIRLKAEMNPSVDRYIDLVNYIDRLERD